MFWSKNKKKVYPCKPQFYNIKVGCKGVFVTRTYFRDDYRTCARQFDCVTSFKIMELIKKAERPTYKNIQVGSFKSSKKTLKDRALVILRNFG